MFVRKLVAQASDDLDHGALLRSVGIEPDAPVDPALMIPDTDYYGLIERIADEDPDAGDLGLRTGASMRCDDYGALGLAFKSAMTLRGFYERLERYARVLSTVATYEVRSADEGVYVHHFRAGERRLGLRVSNDATMAALLTVAREVSSDTVAPEAVFLSHPAPPSTAAHVAFFGCPVHYDSDRDALRYAHDTLKTPNRLGDAGISEFFASHLDEALRQLGDDDPFEQRVQRQISQMLSDGVPPISEVARKLGTSARTLQRRLSEDGHSYQTLVDDSRRRLAKRLLRETDYSLADVAFLTGFSEQSSFSRAFKRWSGQTPRSYRLGGS